MSYEVVIFGIKLTLSPVAFTIPLGSRHWDIYWYGIIIAAGFLLALIYGIKNASRFGLNTDRMLDVVLVATPVAILSARAYYVIFDGEKLTGIGDFFGFGNPQRQLPVFGFQLVAACLELCRFPAQLQVAFDQLRDFAFDTVHYAFASHFRNSISFSCSKVGKMSIIYKSDAVYLPTTRP